MGATCHAPRRLGRLQKIILDIALRNHEAEGSHGQEGFGADVLSTEAIVAHLELPEAEELPGGGRLYSTTIRSAARLGKAEYLSAKASVNVSMRILQRRGLIVPVRGMTGWSGANLTAEGVRVAQSLRRKQLPRRRAAS